MDSDTQQNRDLYRFVRAGLAAAVFAVVLAMYPRTPDPTGDIKTFVYHLAGFASWATVLAVSWAKNRPLRRPRLFFGVLTAWFAVNLLAALRSDFVGNSLVEVSKYASLVLLYLAASQVYRTTAQVRRLMLVTCLAVACSTIYAFFQKAGMDFFPWDPKHLTTDTYLQLPGTFGNPNYAAHTMILCQIMAIYLAMKRGSRWLLVFVALFAAHHYFTGQRGGVAALFAAAALIVIALTVRRRRMSPAPSAAAALALTALAGALLIGAAMLALQARTGRPYPVDVSLLLRYNGYTSASTMALERPLLGYGPGNYKIQNTLFWTPFEEQWFAEQRLLNANVHNDVLESMVDAGVPGAALYIAFLVMAAGFGLVFGYARTDPQERRLGFAFAAMVCAFAVDGFFGFNARVPVSAMLLFLFAGAFEGVWGAAHAPESSPAAPLSVNALAWRVAVALLLLANIVFAVRVFRSQYLLQESRMSLFAGDHVRAERLLDEGERLAPWNWLMSYHRAAAALARNDAPAAIEYLEQSLERHPHYILTLIGLSRTRFNMAIQTAGLEPAQRDALVAGAEADARRALELCSLMADAEEILGRIAVMRALALARPEQDAETDDDAPRHSPEALEQWRLADRHLAHAVRFGAEDASRLYGLLAQARTALEDLDGAQDALLRALDLSPENQDLWPILYQFAMRFDRPEVLREQLERHIRRLERAEPRDADALATLYLYLAQVRQNSYEDADGAEAGYVAALRHNPNRWDIWNAFARYSKQHRRTLAFKQSLLDACDRLHAASAQPLPSVEAVGMVWRHGAQALPEATGLLARAMKERRRGADPVRFRAEFGWPVEILFVEVEQAGADVENRGVALLNLGTMLHALGQLDMADKVLAVAIEALPPERQRALGARERGEVLFGLRRFPEAAAALDTAVKANPGDLRAQLLRARALARAGRIAEAEQGYRRLLAVPTLEDRLRLGIEQELQAVGMAARDAAPAGRTPDHE